MLLILGVVATWTVLLMDGAKDFKMLIVAVAVAVLYRAGVAAVAVAVKVSLLLSTIVIVNAVFPEVVLYGAVSLLETGSVLDVEVEPLVAVVEVVIPIELFPPLPETPLPEKPLSP